MQQNTSVSVRLCSNRLIIDGGDGLMSPVVRRTGVLPAAGTLYVGAVVTVVQDLPGNFIQSDCCVAGLHVNPHQPITLTNSTFNPPPALV